MGVLPLQPPSSYRQAGQAASAQNGVGYNYQNQGNYSQSKFSSKNVATSGSFDLQNTDGFREFPPPPAEKASGGDGDESAYSFGTGVGAGGARGEGQVGRTGVQPEGNDLAIVPGAPEFSGNEVGETTQGEGSEIHRPDPAVSGEQGEIQSIDANSAKWGNANSIPPPTENGKQQQFVYYAGTPLMQSPLSSAYAYSGAHSYMQATPQVMMSPSQHAYMQPHTPTQVH
eukprot:43075_1